MDLVTSKSAMTSDIFFPRLELKESDKAYTVSVEIAGMKEKDIHAKVKNNNLIIEGEKKYESKKEEKNYFSSEFSYGSFYRSIPLPEEVSKKMNTSYKDGVFLVTLDKVKVGTMKKNNKQGKANRKKRIYH